MKVVQSFTLIYLSKLSVLSGLIGNMLTQRLRRIGGHFYDVFFIIINAKRNKFAIID